MCCMHLINPSTPDALSVWATFVLTVPSKTGVARSDLPNTARRAPSSIGSPSAVPVPWHSTNATSSSESPEYTNAALITFYCALPEGAVNDTDLPACCTSIPEIQASMSDVSVCLRAGSNQRAPQPSPRANPSAASSKVAQRPIVDNSWAKVITKVAWRSLI